MIIMPETLMAQNAARRMISDNRFHSDFIATLHGKQQHSPHTTVAGDKPQGCIAQQQ